MWIRVKRDRDYVRLRMYFVDPVRTGINPRAIHTKTAKAALLIERISQQDYAILETLLSLYLGHKESIAINRFCPGA